MAWLLAYPDTYEIGLPNQGLQILYEILNERADAVAERTYAPWTDLEEQLRAHDVPLFSVDTPPRRRPTSTSWPSTSRPSSTYTNLLNMVDLAGCPVRAADRAAARPAHRRRRPLHLQPRAHRRLPRLRGAGRRRGGRGRDHRGGRRAGRPAGKPGPPARCSGPSPASPASTCRRCTTPCSDDGQLVEIGPERPRRARRGREAHHRRPGRVAVPEATSSCRSPRSSTTASTSRSSGAAPGAAGSARPA